MKMKPNILLQLTRRLLLPLINTFGLCLLVLPALAISFTHPVEPKQFWSDSGLDVPAGTWQLVVNASGSVSACSGCPDADADGRQSGGIAPAPANSTFLAPGLFSYSLVGRIGPTGTPFQLGTNATVTVQGPGRFQLAFNDCCDFTDNTGQYAVSGSITAPTSFTHQVDPKQTWSDSGLDVPAGTWQLVVNASGTVSACSGCPDADADGRQSGGIPPAPADSSFLAPGLFSYSLVGRIGPTGTPFQLGKSASLIVSGPGRLQLAFNDCCNFADNTRQFEVSGRLIEDNGRSGYVSDISMYPGIVVAGQPGETYWIEGSTNATEPILWTRLASITLTTSSYAFVDLESAGRASRLYRAIRQ